MSCGIITINIFQYNWFEFYNLIYMILICDLNLNKITDDEILFIANSCSFIEKQKNKFIEIIKNIKNNIITTATFNVFNWNSLSSDNDIELSTIIWKLCINKIKNVYNKSELGQQNLNILFKNLSFKAGQNYNINSDCYLLKIIILNKFKTKIENDYRCVIL